MCQFHQHFTGNFFANILALKIARPNIFREKLLNSLLYEKRACKMLMKLTQVELLTLFTFAASSVAACNKQK